MVSFEKRLVLGPEVSRDDVEDLAWDLDWNIHELGEEEAGARIDIWRTDDGKTEIHRVEDRPIGLTYLTLRGAAVTMTEQQVRSVLRVWAQSDALVALHDADGRDERLRGLYALALTADDLRDGAVVNEFRAAASDPDPGIRQAVVVAAGYRPDPALVELVAELRESDPVSFVRENADILLKGIRLHGGE
ncbi:HEAT repeat domain-containing protein [Streptomyces syringium]|uniref:HEAT repeat domain-containing protein n=1 Tax=Streptomyces syringium TaxID=76729 RepID=UPI0034329B1A